MPGSSVCVRAPVSARLSSGRHIRLLLNLQELALWQKGGVPSPPLHPSSLSLHTLFKNNLLLGRELGVKEGSGKEKAFRRYYSCCFCSKQHVRCFMFSVGIHIGKVATSHCKYYCCKRHKLQLFRVFLLF